MKSFKYAIPLLGLVFVGTIVWAYSSERYLHVKVDNPKTHELVRVNVPLSLAEKVIPAISSGQLRNGSVHVGHLSANSVNLKTIFDALKTAPEGDFVTVQENDSDVRVAKEKNRLVVHVVDKGGKENVDVIIPWDVAQALASDINDDQLNVEAAIKALENAGDVTLVSITDRDETVRVWIDSRSTAE